MNRKTKILMASFLIGSLAFFFFPIFLGNSFDSTKHIHLFSGIEFVSYVPINTIFITGFGGCLGSLISFICMRGFD